jgi:hydroxyethylthiazole kinase-like uncharacterized protein yjeF
MQKVLPLAHELALFDTVQTRTLEQRAAAALPAHTLMRRAGEAVARLALAIAPNAQQIWIAAGPGNNGGDGLEAAIHLLGRGKQVQVTLTGDPAAMPPDAQAALARAHAVGVRIEASATAPTEMPQLAIDALLGVGANRAPHDSIAAAIHALNALTCPVLAVDLPSGLHADTGRPLGTDCVLATHTLALLTLKAGLFTGAGRDHAAEVWLDTLGVDASVTPPHAWLSGLQPGSGRAPRRHAQHKGSFGEVAVVGGASGMRGAALLAARAAHAAGAGRVYVELLDPDARASGIDPMRPELMFRPDWSRSAPQVLEGGTVVCGCGGADAVRVPLPRLLTLAARLVLDADALNVMANDDSLIALLRARSQRGQATVLTPHPLEAARLLHCTTPEIQNDRLRAAVELASRFACVVVLKGSGSVVAAPGQAPRINCTGNAALATAGTGDVLAGWLAGHWAQCSPGNEAATAFAVASHAVAEHGAAAEPQARGPLRAADLVERLHARLA